MLHEIFLSLLGFTGDIIIEDEGTYQVCKSFDLLTTAERQQINRIVPLGWYYASLSSFVVFYEVKWGVKMGDPDSQFYRTAMSQGIADVLAEYANDIAYLEQLVLAEGPVPLSHVLHHLQKYLLIMPVLHSMWIELEKKKIWGCQLLDFIKSKRSGMPVIDNVVGRMMIKVRAVFLKQCLAWMLYGELEDPAEEFFIQSRGSDVRRGDSNSGQQQEEQLLRAEMLNRFGNSSAAMWSSSARGSVEDPKADQLSFDWNTTFSLRLDLLPESHVSPRIASKIMFCGKAVKLLLSANKTANRSDMPQLRDIFKYLSKGASPSRNHFDVKRETPVFVTPTSRAVAGANSNNSSNSNIMNNNASTNILNASSNSMKSSGGKDEIKQRQEDSDRNKNEFKNSIDRNNNKKKDEIPPKNTDDNTSGMYDNYFERCGFSREDIERFTNRFHSVLSEPHLALQLLESLVDDIHSSISGKLWNLLRDQFGFTNFLLSMRNTFLMGKGELYHLILDGIIEQTKHPAPDSQKADNILKWDIVRGAGKTLNLDDDSLAATLSIRVNASNLAITDFSAVSGTVVIAGGAKYEILKAVATGRKRPNRNVSLCTIIEENSSAELCKLWSTHVLNKSADMAYSEKDYQQRKNVTKDASSGKYGNENKINNNGRAKYTQGAVWLPDQKYVAKGFTTSAVFECGWSAVRESVTLSHPHLSNSYPTIIPSELDNNGTLPEEKSELSFADSVHAPHSPQGMGVIETDRNRPDTGPLTPRGSRTPRLHRAASGHLLLGGMSCVVHSDRQGTQALGSGDLGLDLNGVVTVGVSFHAHIVEDRRIPTNSSAGNNHKYNNNNNNNNINNNSGKSNNNNNNSNNNMSANVSVQYYARVFISVKGDQRSRFSRSSNNLNLNSTSSSSSSASASVGGTDGVGFADSEGSDSSVVSECFIDMDRTTALAAGLGEKNGPGRCMSSGGTMLLEVEYHRELVNKGGVGVRASVTGAPTGGKLTQGPGTGGAAGLVMYKLRGRLRENTMSKTDSKVLIRGWDVEATVDLTHHVRLLGGQAYVGFVGSGVVFSEGTPHSQTARITIGRQLFAASTPGGDARKPASSLPSIFDIKLSYLEFNGKGALATYPVASLFTSARYPDTFLRLEREVSQFRAWMNLKLTFRFPALFKIIFDSDAMGAYERLFTTIMKVRLVAHALEGVWKTISRSHLKGDRSFCQVRHSMQFFISNLLFHLQVDVVDSEFCTLLEETSAASDFQSVLRAHREFLSTITRLSSVDNLVIQEGIERVLQVCLRFVAVCRLLHQQDDDVIVPNSPKDPGSNSVKSSSDKKRFVPVVIPPEEIEGVRKELFTQISYLFQIMRKVENRGLMFRLDFNGYLSSLAEEAGSTVDR